jgi:Universal stress protein family
LVAYDGSPQAQRATELAFSVAEAMQSKVLIFAVIRPPEPAARAELNAVLDDAREHYEQSFTQLRGLFGTDGQCVGEMIFCVHEPQYAAQDPSFGYNIWCAKFYLRHTAE